MDVTKNTTVGELVAKLIAEVDATWAKEPQHIIDYVASKARTEIMTVFMKGIETEAAQAELAKALTPTVIGLVPSQLERGIKNESYEYRYLRETMVKVLGDAVLAGQPSIQQAVQAYVLDNIKQVAHEAVVAMMADTLKSGLQGVAQGMAYEFQQHLRQALMNTNLTPRY